MNTVVTHPAAERRFYVSAAIGITVVVLAGFSIDLDLLRDMSALSALVRLHGAGDARLDRAVRHADRAGGAPPRRLASAPGIFGAALAAVIVIADAATAVVAFRLGGTHLPPGMPAPLFLALALFDLLTFAILVSGAIACAQQRLAQAPDAARRHHRARCRAGALHQALTPRGGSTLDARDGLRTCSASSSTPGATGVCTRRLPSAGCLFRDRPVARWVAPRPVWARVCGWLG